MHPLPIDGFVSQIQATVTRHQNCILSAAPGAGKSTRVLPALLDSCAGDVILLQPRRVAARSIARRIADEQGWELGQTIGWQVRFERHGNSKTRLWVVTEGILARRLMSDPYLEGVSCVILDEFHERHLDSDLILSWCKELQSSVRDDLSLIVMSATMDLESIHTFLPEARCIEVPGQEYPLHIAYKPAQDDRRYLEHICTMVRTAVQREDSGSILVFLPGVGEINGLRQMLDE
ncbi:MAG: DEAD/DEAH box helicase, partial [Planctomycetes bacterium]|nr:DEAD/DEAH box helicase [Planctomycetota bacterium]